MPLAVIRSFTGICFCSASARAFSRASGVPLPVADLDLLRCLASRNAEKLSALDRSIRPLHKLKLQYKAIFIRPNFRVEFAAADHVVRSSRIPNDFGEGEWWSSAHWQSQSLTGTPSRQ